MDNPKALGRCVKKTVGGFSQKQLEKFSGTLHAYRELDKTRLRLLGHVAKTDVRIAAQSGVLDCSAVPAHKDKCLQVADFVAWACYMKYEHGEERYFDTIADKILHEYQI